MTICIRKASRGEAARAAALAIRMWEDHTLEDLTDEFRELIANQEAAVYLLYENDKPVGFAQCQLRHDYVEGTETSPVGYLEGIYVDEFSNGQVKIGEGDFTFFVKSGFLIENGRLTAPVKDINIIGNGPQALADIIAVGNDLKIDNGTWTCGKEQSVPVSCGMPTVLISSLTVGGE